MITKWMFQVWLPLAVVSAAIQPTMVEAGVDVVWLRCEYRVNPLGIDIARPRLSWILESDERGQKQIAYQVLVAGSEEKLAGDQGDLWDSGKVESDQSIQVIYKGKPLAGRKRCYWKVRVWDKAGRPSAWSKPATWSMGLLDKSDWQGDWIGTADKPEQRNPAHAAPLLRKEVQIEKQVVRATAYVCGLGYYELHIDGQKISDHVLDPGFTDYAKRSLYVTYDVTDQLNRGRHAVGVILGNGWYALPTPDLFGFEKAPWTAPPKLLLNIDLEFADGTRQTIATDTTWKWSTGPIVFNCVRGGETYDARNEKSGWSKCGYNDSDWQPAKIVAGPGGQLAAQQHPPIRVTQSIKPVKLTEPKPGCYVFDLGVNIAGWVRLKTSGKRGQKITLHFNELLNSDGTLNTAHLTSHTHGRFQTGQLILKGQGIEVYEPRFTYHGFRYVQVTGLTEKPTLDNMTGRFVHTDVKPAGEFACSNEKINKIQELIVRTQLSNLHGIPTDCPQREKMGWTLDGCMTMEEAIFNFDMAPFYSKWFQDMLDAQISNGYVESFVPGCGWPRTRDPWCGGAIVMAPWKLHQYYGDKRILEQGYEAMRAYVDYVGTTATDHIVKWELGDWLEVGKTGPSKRTPIEQVDTCAYFYCTKIVSQTAALLGKNDDAKKYGALAEAIRASFNKHFLDQATGLYAKDSQTAQVLPLYFGMVPQDGKELVLNRLVENIKVKRSGHLSTGIVGTLYLMYGLTDFGHADLAYTIATQEDFPGWFYMINNGATAIWEGWHGGRESRNHPVLGSIGAWYFQTLAGIRPDPTGPGFKKIIIKPEIVGDLTWAKGSYNSVHGKIVSDWKIDKGTFTLNVTIPPGTSATVYVPTKNPDTVAESGKPARQAEGVSYIGNRNGAAVYRVDSGHYVFVASAMK